MDKVVNQQLVYNFVHSVHASLLIFSFLINSRQSMFTTMGLIYRRDGISKGLYRGLTINYMRAMPMVAVSFSTYELLKQALGLDTGALPIKIG